jgi:hypothetical protein
VRDLTLTGCVANVYRVQRTQAPERLKNAGGDTLRTDGRVAVVQLRDCEAAPNVFLTSSTAVPSRPRTKWARFVRTQALSIHDLWRSNAIYASFDVTRMFIHSLQNRSLQNRRIREYEAAEKNLAVEHTAGGAN